MNKIYINYGEDAISMTMELMERAGVSALLGPGMNVVIKPNLVTARPADGGATTHPQIVEGIVLFLKKNGVDDITIAEGAWVGEGSTHHAFKRCGYHEIGQKYNIRMVDTKKDRPVTKRFKDMSLKLCETPLNADFLINVPVLKGHCQTVMTCCLKNLKGCIPDGEKRRYHSEGLDKPIAALNAVLRPHLHIVDSICGDLTFEEGGNPVQSDRIMLGFDPVLLDSYSAGLIGYQPDEIGHLKLARQYGVGNYADHSTEIVELNADIKPKKRLVRSGIAKKLSSYIEEDSACSACYANLIFALNNSRRKPPGKLKIGQGWKDRQCAGQGIGNCTSGCEHYVRGCPPAAVDILDFLKKQL